MKSILNYASNVGFDGVVKIETNQIPFDATLVKYCQENLCGRYAVNYSCPPHCGNAKQMQDAVLCRKYAVVVQSFFNNVSFDDKQAVADCKQTHANRLQQLLQFSCDNGYDAFIIGATGCERCNPCAVVENKPCPYKEQIHSCTSAYGINVAQLLKNCSMSYEWQDGKLYLCGLLIVR